MSSVILVQVDPQVEPVIRQAVESEPGRRVEAVQRPEEALGRLEHGAVVDAVVLGSTVEAPVEVAQRIGAVDRNVTVLILTNGETHGRLARALQFAPFLGEDVQCRPVAEPESLAAALAGALQATQHRRRYQATVASLNTRLGAVAAAGPAAAGYLQQLVHHAPVGIVVTDAYGLVVTWNRAAVALFGRSERDALGRPLSELFPDAPPGPLRDMLAGKPASTNGSSTSGLVARTLEDGRSQYLEVTITPLGPESGGPGHLVIFQDVTQRMHHLEERRRAEELATHRARQQAAVAGLGQRALSERSLQALFDDACRLVAETLQVEYVKLLQLVPGGRVLELRAGVGWRAGLVGSATVDAGHGSQAGYTLARRSPLIVEDLRTDTRFQASPLLVEHGVVSGVSVVIESGAEPFGVLGAHTGRRRRFTEDDVHFLRSVANVLGAAIQRRQAERAMERREAEFRTLAQNIPDIVARFDRDLRHLYLNPVIEAVTGRPAEDFLGKTSREAGMPPQLCDVWERHLRRVFQTGEEETLEFVFRSPAGDRHFQSRVVPELDESGSVVTVLGITRDITELKHAEDAQRFLAEAGAALAGALTYQEILAALARLAVPRLADGSILYVVDEDGGIQRATAVFQDPEKQRIFAEAAARFPVPDREDYPVTRVIRTGELLLVPDAAAWERPAVPDDEMWSAAAALGVRSFLMAPLVARGRTLGAVCLMTAESGRRYGPADLALARELAGRAALAADNARLYREAQQAARLREEFLSIASHELRTPLTTVKGYVQLLARHVRQPEVDPDRVNGLVEQLEVQVLRLERLVADLLDASRLQQGRLELQPEPVDLTQLAAEVLARFAHAPERTPSHTLTLEAPEPVRGVWDPGRLDQVLSNLLSNALKYSPEGGPVRLTVHEREGWAEITVSDAGLGIPADEQEALFRPFVRGQTTRRTVSGEGLGLYITRQIVERHGGSVRLASEPGRGTTVTIRLPLTPPAADEAPTDG